MCFCSSAHKNVVFACVFLQTVLHTASSARMKVDWGEAVPFGNGYMQSFLHHGRSGDDRPDSLGVQFSYSLFENAPSNESDGQYDVLSNNKKEVVWYCCGHEIKPSLPQSAFDLTAFQHVVVNFNPNGHPPAEIYGVPHMDFHFYTQTEEQRLAIPGAKKENEMCSETIPMACDDKDELTKDLPCDQNVVDYFNVDAVEPAMCNHLIDLTSSEFMGYPFEYTFIWNTCYGDICGFEPMIAHDFLKGLKEQKGGGRKVCIDIKTPAALPKAGYYPTSYCMEYKVSEDVLIVALNDWELFPQSNQAACSA